MEDCAREHHPYSYHYHSRWFVTNLDQQLLLAVNRDANRTSPTFSQGEGGLADARLLAASPRRGRAKATVPAFCCRCSLLRVTVRWARSRWYEDGLASSWRPASRHGAPERVAYGTVEKATSARTFRTPTGWDSSGTSIIVARERRTWWGNSITAQDLA